MAERVEGPARGRPDQQAERRHQHCGADPGGGPHGKRQRHGNPSHDQHRRQPRELTRCVVQHDQLGGHAAGHGERSHHSRDLIAPKRERCRRAHERRRERREQRHVVRVEDALREAERHGAGEERAAGGDQPSGARVAAAQPRHRDQGDPAGHRHAEQPAGLPAERLVEEAERAGGAPEGPASAERLNPRPERESRLSAKRGC